MHRACSVFIRVPRALTRSTPLDRAVLLGQSQSVAYSLLRQKCYYGNSTSSARNYSNKARQAGGRGGKKAIKAKQTSDGSPEAPREISLEMLEAISRGRWVSAFPDGNEDRLRLAHFRLTQLLVYLYRPEDPNPENAERLTYYLTFKSAKPGTEIRRARDAIAIIIRAVLKCLSTIPLDSGVRRHTTIFDVVDNLTTISDTYMDQGGRVEEWTEFWGGTQLVLLDLNKKLESAGFGFGSHSEGAQLMSRTEEQATGEEEIGDGALRFQALESTARSPLLTFYHGDHEDRLAHARSRMLQIFLYLFAEPGQHRRFFDFASATVGPETEIARARIAVAIITRAVIDNLSTIPMDSQVRSKYHAIFDRVDVLVALKKKHLMDESGRVKNWATFWMKAQSELLHLGTLLDEAGIGSSKKK